MENNMTKPTKETSAKERLRLAEVMAKFLRWTQHNEPDSQGQKCFPGETQYWKNTSGLIQDPQKYMYTPEGFFAVWDMLHIEVGEHRLETTTLINFWSKFNYLMGLRGETRYIEFYKIINELLK
jgi:hypothetical protein